MKNDTQYLAYSFIRSRQFAALRSSASILITVTIICSIISLITGVVQISLPVLLTAVGISLMHKYALKAEDINNSITTTPSNFFLLSIIVRSLANALIIALCIAVCVAGKDVIDRFITDEIITMLNEQVTQLQINITEDMLYMSVYLACLLGMFICAGDMIMSGISFIFMTSVRSSVKSGKVELSLLNLFTVTLFIRGIFALIMLLFSISGMGMALYGVTAYMYFSAYRCAKSIDDLYK